jgi:hypothetical protein
MTTKIQPHSYSFFRAILIGLLLCGPGCKTTSMIGRNPSSTILPNWVLLGIDQDMNIKGVPDENCLQKYMEQWVPQKSEDPEPFLAKRVLEVAEAMRIDPYIFAGLIQQESGDFVADTGRNGVGLTQMTNVAIRDACTALEGTNCTKAQANPKYLEVWESLFAAAVKESISDLDFRYYYPWRSECFLYEHRCEADCGIDNKCMIKIRDKLFRSYRINLIMGAFTLVNKLGEAKAKHPSLKGSELYKSALVLYNGHEIHKFKYAREIMKRHVPAILRACPPVQ